MRNYHIYMLLNDFQPILAKKSGGGGGGGAKDPGGGMAPSVPLVPPPMYRQNKLCWASCLAHVLSACWLMVGEHAVINRGGYKLEAMV